ncbi:hypothetical protein NEAUS06_0115 [Nematocida ausubeli]|nr:hypothetical protein NEAUS06_0115 [Nematocida ausubeli]
MRLSQRTNRRKQSKVNRGRSRYSRMADKKEEVLRNEIVHNTLSKLQITDAPNSNQIIYVVKRANLSSTVVLAAVSLLFTARERLGAYVQQAQRNPKACKDKGASLEVASLLYNSTYILFSVCLVVTSKYLIDRSYINRTWANILMINKRALNEYEMCLLEVLDYRINVSMVSMNNIIEKIEETDQGKKEKRENKFFRNIKRIMSCLFKNIR